MLGTSKIVAFAATTRPDASKLFYEETLGLRLVGDDKFAIVFDANGTMLRIQKVEEHAPPEFTVLGWDVADITATIGLMTARGVGFERYFWLEQDERGIWTAPGGAQVAWFKDPDGNLLSLTQFGGQDSIATA
jgi:catechol 2,3-dioxygenase-like lactoylglutathione lyase family enzyme